MAKAFDADTTARIFAMVENIDDNVGRVLATLDALALANDTIVVFLTDNGPRTRSTCTPPNFRLKTLMSSKGCCGCPRGAPPQKSYSRSTWPWLHA